VSPVARASRAPDDLLKLLGELPVVGLAHGRDLEMRRRLALDELKRVGVEFRGAHASLIETVIAFEDDRQTKLMDLRDAENERLLRSRADGRPNKHSVLQDLFVFAVQRWFQLGGQLKARDARKRTAQLFGFTYGTKYVRTRRPSIEQVRRAEGRMLDRFLLLRKARGDGFTKPVVVRAARVIDAYMNGAPLDAAFLTDATRIVYMCRLLEALERSDRIEKTAARKAVKRVTRQPGKAATPAKRELG
jgi:hypothetical protein